MGEEGKPVLTIVGGGGAMGSLLAEFLLPKVAGCILVDRFPEGTAISQDDRKVSTMVALQRLAPVVRREGWSEHRFILAGKTGAWHLASAWDLHETPALAVYSTDALPDIDEERESLTQWIADLRSFESVRGLVGLASPTLAAEIAEATDILLVATPYISRANFREVIRPYAKGLRPGTLYGDVLSLKEQPLAVAAEILPKSVGIIGLHPLFGRAVVDSTGLVVAVAPAPDGRPSVRWERWLLNVLATLGLLLTPTSGAEHDAAMSYVQALTHFVLLSFAYTFVRANQDPTQLLPFRTPVFEPLLYLAARVTALAQRTPDVYRAIQEETAHPELRRLFVDTAQMLLRAIEKNTSPEVGVQKRNPLASLPSNLERTEDSLLQLVELLEELGAPWTPEYHQYAEPYEHLIAMSNTLTDRINSLRYQLLLSNGCIRGIRNVRTGTIHIGSIYVDPQHHDRVDLASRVRFRRFNLTLGMLEGENASGQESAPALLGSLPLAQAELIPDYEVLLWLLAHTGPRSGRDDGRGRSGEKTTRPRYAGRGHFDLSLAVPAWLDEESAERLLVREWHKAVHLVWVDVKEQSVPSEWIPPGGKAVIFRIVLLITPQRLLELRRVSRNHASEITNTVQQNQEWNRQFADRVKKELSTARDAVARWLFAHGGTELRRHG